MATRRLPLVPVVVATVLAVAAASAVFVLLGGGDGGSPSASGATGGGAAIELSEAPAPDDLPTSSAEVELAALGGGRDRRLGDYLARGRPVLLNFFASWCAPCLREMPAFEAIHQDLGDQVTVLGLAYQDEPDRAREMVERTHVTYPTFADRGGRAITFFGGTSMPTTVFIGADGEVAGMSNRELTERQLRDQVADLLEQGG